MLTYPAFDPVAVSLFGFDVRWYGLAYVAGFIATFFYLKWAITKHPARNMGLQVADDVFTWGILGVIIGGRLGYVLFYNLPYFLDHPIDIFKTWHGGMSFHGGLLGVLISLFIYCQRNDIHFLDVMDRLAPGACIGLFFGRIANFINGELWGRVSDVPWAMVFPSGGPLPRHPSQLYEALFEGLLLCLILHLVLRKRWRRGEVSGLFMIGYGIIRFGIEYVREPDDIPQNAFLDIVTTGQLLCIPMVLIGLYVLQKSRKEARHAA